jgi:hypothetical protein
MSKIFLMILVPGIILQTLQAGIIVANPGNDLNMILNNTKEGNTISKGSSLEITNCWYIVIEGLTFIKSNDLSGLLTYLNHEVVSFISQCINRIFRCCHETLITCDQYGNYCSCNSCHNKEYQINICMVSIVLKPPVQQKCSERPGYKA